MSFWGYKPYVPVAERRRKAEALAAKAKKKGEPLSPVAASRGAIAKTFWGKAWCDNLERYSDYANRLPRGRTYLRNGSVIDLQVSNGTVKAQVAGSSLYKVNISVTGPSAAHWKSIASDCSGSIDSLVELLQGKLSKAVMERICAPTVGLFPSPKELEFNCSCPDWASMCKHVAAVFYGIGARLDQQPDLIFKLRGVDAQDLISQASAGLSGAAVAKKSSSKKKVLDDSSLADVFGIEMAAEIAPTSKTATPRSAAKKKTSAKKPAAKVVVKAVKVAPTSKPAIKTGKAIKPVIKATKPVAKLVAKVSAKATKAPVKVTPPVGKVAKVSKAAKPATKPRKRAP